MTQPINGEGELLCPIPNGRGSKCGEDLYWSWQLEMPACASDFGAGPIPRPEDAWSGSWELRCVAGHVLLVPLPMGALCEHPSGPDDPPCPGHDEDSSEELRTVRLSDLVRMRDVLRSFGGPVVDLGALDAVVRPAGGA